MYEYINLYTIVRWNTFCEREIDCHHISFKENSIYKTLVSHISLKHTMYMQINTAFISLFYIYLKKGTRLTTASS